MQSLLVLLNCLFQMSVLFDLTIFLHGNALCYHFWELIWDENIHSAIDGLHNRNTNLPSHFAFFKAGSSWVFGCGGVGAAEGRVWLWVRAPPPPPPHSACHMHRAICPPPPPAPHTHIHYHLTYHIPTTYSEHICHIPKTYEPHIHHRANILSKQEGYNDKTHMLHHQRRGTGYLLESCHNFVHSTKHFWVGTLERYIL